MTETCIKPKCETRVRKYSEKKSADNCRINLIPFSLSENCFGAGGDK